MNINNWVIIYDPKPSDKPWLQNRVIFDVLLTEWYFMFCFGEMSKYPEFCEFCGLSLSMAAGSLPNSSTRCVNLILQKRSQISDFLWYISEKPQCNKEVRTADYKLTHFDLGHSATARFLILPLVDSLHSLSIIFLCGWLDSLLMLPHICGFPNR